MNKRTSFIDVDFKTREEGAQKLIEGYFIVFNQRTELWQGFHEQIAPEAVNDLSDIRALYNHDHNLVLGSTLNGTLKLAKDDYGIKGVIEINEKDSDAVNAYERIKRGDVKGCSFGFELLSEEYTQLDDGGTLATVRELNLFEVSPCVFPAYPQTAINARKQDYDDHQKRARAARQDALKERINHGIKTSHSSEQD